MPTDELVELFGVYCLPLVAAILFAFAAVSLRVTAKEKIGIWRVSFVSNVVTALAFQPYWFLCESLPPLNVWWQPFLVALLFIAGQVLTLLALTKGEISVAAPVLGLKIVFVPFFIWLLRVGELPVQIWSSCFMSAIALMLLNFSDGASNRRMFLYSATTAAAGAGAFAMFDVCVQIWSPVWGQGGFLPVMFIMSTVLSLAMIPAFEARLRLLPARAWPSLLAGSLFFALQALAIVGSVAFWGKAAPANVVYSTRGVWSLVLIALAGSWLGVQEAGLSPRVFVVRLLGALLLLVAIVLLVV